MSSKGSSFLYSQLATEKLDSMIPALAYHFFIAPALLLNRLQGSDLPNGHKHIKWPDNSWSGVIHFVNLWKNKSQNLFPVMDFKILEYTGWICDIVLGDKNKICMLNVDDIQHIEYEHGERRWFNFLRTWSNMLPVIQALAWQKYCTGNFGTLTPLKHLGFQITTADSLPLTALTIRVVVNFCYALFPHLHSDPFSKPMLRNSMPKTSSFIKIPYVLS